MEEKSKVAVVIHLFFEDQWWDFEDGLNNFDSDFSLFVSLRPESTFGAHIQSRFPNAIVVSVPNLGRDVAPFLDLLPRLDAFDAVCKLHTKRTEGRHTDWRRSLINGLIGSSETINTYCDAFANDPDLVLAGPREYYLDGPSHEMNSKKALALQHGKIFGRYGFFAGTMFWCRPSVYAGLSDTYPQDCFVAHADDDGHPEHVVERAFGYIASASGKNVMLWDGEVEIAPAASLRGNTDFASVYDRTYENKAGSDAHERRTGRAGRPSLYDIHLAHDGLVSDKWTGNLIQYERLLKELRDREVRLFEIGVQNGGSLQIWAKYFEQGRKFIGCDIDSGCGELKFGDSRISVIVGDAGASVVKSAAMRICGQFDLIIDDGSHLSSDIIRAFLSFFPTLVPDGLFVIESMSCRYWQEFDGSLDCDTSSLAFFKEAANVINKEHWPVDVTIESRFERFINAYDLDFNSRVLEPIQSIEFLDSMVVVRKGNKDQTRLGQRMVHGKTVKNTGAGKFLEGADCAPPGVICNDLAEDHIPDPEPKEMSISVVIPFFNGRAFLQDAVDSVLAQTHPAREIVIVNDGSNDQETRWLKEYSETEEFVLISQKNMGLGGARNTGAKAARGTHICFLDQDDTFLPHHNKVLVDHWRSSAATMSSLGWVFADVSQVNQNLSLISEKSFPYPDCPVLERPCEFISRDAAIFPGATMICRDRFLAVGGFDESLVGYENDDLYLRMLLDGSVTSFCPFSVTCWRRHPDQSSREKIFMRSAERFFNKWFGHDWGDVEESALADAKLKARMVLSLSVCLNEQDFADRGSLWRFFSAVQDARSPHRPTGDIARTQVSGSTSLRQELRS